MKNHQHSFLSRFGDAGHIQDLLDRQAYREHGNPSLNIDHFRYQMKYWSGMSSFPSIDRAGDVGATKEDLHDMINGGWAEPTLHPSVKNFDDSHVRSIADSSSYELHKAAVEKSSMSSEQHEFFFGGENPRYKRGSIALGLALNPHINQEHFDKIWNHSFSHDEKTKFSRERSPASIRYALMLKHPEKLKQEQVDQLYHHGVSAHESTVLRDRLTQHQWDTLRVK